MSATGELRAWNDTLLVSRIIAAMLAAERLGQGISSSTPFERNIAEECRDAFGRLIHEPRKSDYDKAQDEIAMVPRGILMAELWRNLEALRAEWIALRMSEAGFKRNWLDIVGGDVMRRGSVKYDELNRTTPTIEQAINDFRERVRLKGSLAA